MRIAGYRNRLTEDHLVWMRIPVRFWDARLDRIQDPSLKEVVRQYGRDIDQNLDEGSGLLFYGDNSLGKTCAAVVLAKEARRVGASVLFITAESLRQSVIDKTRLYDDVLVYDRAEQVDVLILDDLAKEHSDDGGWSRRTIENLLRVRSANCRVTIITTNASLEKLERDYKASFTEILREACLPVRVEGKNLRAEAGEELRARLVTG